MSDQKAYIHRDISWLSFNYRVLQEAKDPAVPLFERLKFLGIYSSNLDEFYRVRVANHQYLVRTSKKTIKKLDHNPKEILEQIQRIVNNHQKEFTKIFNEEIVPDLKNHGISILLSKHLDKAQRSFIENFFLENLLPFAQPVLLKKGKVNPFLNNAALYLTIHLEDKEVKKAEPQYALVKIPSDHIDRFIELPSSKNTKFIMILDDLVRHSLPLLFPGYNIKDTFSIKITRDAELYIDDEYSGNLIQKIWRSLNKRDVGPASRMVYDRKMSPEMLSYLMEMFDLKNEDLLAEGRYHNNSDFLAFPKFELSNLQDPEFPPLPYPGLDLNKSIFTQLNDQDHLIHVPYHDFEPIIRFFEEASEDPYVTHIKIIQYRVGSDSRIMNALMTAVKRGKNVTAFIEVKARFDEESNLRWGEKMEKAGVNVIYSFPGLKVHSKLALVRRYQDGHETLYSDLSTGNFNEKTVKIYSDFSLLTSDPRITVETARLFSFLETVQIPAEKFQHLIVGQFGLKNKLIELLEFEIDEAKAGREGHVILKMNSLQDEEMINLLYKASEAGVKIELIIRGICSLVPGIKGQSENITAVGIVDRFLEHSRVFVYHNAGDPKVFLSSADWMVRNLHHRIETIFPIYATNLKNELIQFLQLQLRDNVKARLHNAEQSNPYHRSDDIAIRSQSEIYLEKKRELQSAKSVVKG